VIIDGTFPIDDFNERFNTTMPDEDYHTMAGFVFGLLGRQPEAGDTITHDGMRFDVLEIEGSRILKLAVTFEQRREQRDRDDVEREALEAELFDADS
jgi:putative hemolysin